MLSAIALKIENVHYVFPWTLITPKQTHTVIAITNLKTIIFKIFLFIQLSYKFKKRILQEEINVWYSHIHTYIYIPTTILLL